MNLTTDAWIPIVWKDGKPGTVSLCETFERGEEIQDLAVRPHERIAVMRLLICIAQAALDGPNDDHDWKSCRPRIGPAALAYLKRWHASFELLGNGPRFMQVPNLKKPTAAENGDDEGNSTTKLDLALATGNNTTLFDNAGGEVRVFTPAQLALMLVTFQCFSPGGRIGVAFWDRKQTPGKGSSNHAPCLAGGMLHTLIRGEHLLAALHGNLLTRTQAALFFGRDCWGKPVWESMPQRQADAEAVRNASDTYLGRLVPLARAIWLADDRRSLILANGLEYPSYTDGWREPSATVVLRRTVKEQVQPTVLAASFEKAVWRELHALTVKAVGQNPGGPAALQNIGTGEEAAFDLWVGGLVANKAKLLDTTESVFHVPSAMFSEPGQLAYEKGVRHAETTEFRVKRAVTVYHKELGDNVDRPEMRNRRQQIQNNAAARFWTDIEQAVPRLLEVAAAPGSLGPQLDWHGTVWGRAVWRAALACYEQACPHGTPRQMRAYALGLKTLFGAPAVQGELEVEKEIEA